MGILNTGSSITSTDTGLSGAKLGANLVQVLIQAIALLALTQAEMVPTLRENGTP